MTGDLFHKLVAQAALAPSVHNVQPARWRQQGDDILLLEDRACHLPAGDPSGRDAALSLGAALEGLCLAAGQEGFQVEVTPEVATEARADLPVRARITLAPGATPDPLAAAVADRRSWRGPFLPPTADDRRAARDLDGPDCALVCDPGGLADIARLYDQASLGFLRQSAFRRELLSWMRLSTRHARWDKDGLNADAMHLGRLERLGAGLLMGRAFGAFDRLGLAKPLLEEAAKTRTATAVLVFHRPVDEPALESGRAFYRAWLRIEAAGFGAAVLAALADDPQTAQALADRASLPAGRRVVSAFRIGRRPPHRPVPRARRPISELIV